jgi:transcriptional regulator with XRE-family HTH domain
VKHKTKKDGYPERLQNLRSRMGLSLRELAIEFRVCHGAIHHWENGIRSIPGPVQKLIELYEEKYQQQVGTIQYA